MPMHACKAAASDCQCLSRWEDLLQLLKAAFVQVFGRPGCLPDPRTPTAGGRKAPRHEIAEVSCGSAAGSTGRRRYGGRGQAAGCAIAATAAVVLAGDAGVVGGVNGRRVRFGTSLAVRPPVNRGDATMR